MKNLKTLIFTAAGAAAVAGTVFFLAAGDAGRSPLTDAGKPSSKLARHDHTGKPHEHGHDHGAGTEATAPKLMSKAQSPLVFTLAPSLAAPLQKVIPEGVDPRTLPQPNVVFSTTVLERSSLPDLARLKEGQVIGLPLPDGRSFDGRIGMVRAAPGGITRVGGILTPDKAGTFTIGQQEGKLAGLIRVPAENRGFVIETQPDGQVLMQEHRLSDLECMSMPGNPDAPPPAPAVAGKPAPAPPTIPAFDSLPSSSAVIYIDFDGETIDDVYWNTQNGDQPILALAPVYNGAALTTLHMTQVCQAVAEDYAPFNISVTTNRARYDAALPGARMRCIVTPTNFYNAGDAGASVLGSFSTAGTVGVQEDIPCFCFGIYDPANMALVISHEVGHTFGLHHDGLSSPAQQYYSGFVNGSISWGPIMGNPYNRKMTQWSQGEYANANQFEDDIRVIAATPGVGYVVDTAGDDLGGAMFYNPPVGTIDIKGVIAAQDTASDLDVYKISAVPGNLTVTCTPSSPFPNFDAVLTLKDKDFNDIGVAAAPVDSLSATITFPITAADTYYIEVRGSANGVNYSDYGSVGAYSLTGSYTVPAATPVFTVQPRAVTVAEGSTATLVSKALTTGKLTYKWFKDGNPLVPASTAANLSLGGIKPTQAGLYKVQAANGANAAFAVFSDEVQVTVLQKPKITTQPSNVTKLAGTSHTFTVVAVGTDPGNELKYTWERTSKPVLTFPQSTNPDLDLTNISIADAGTYRVKVTNATGVVVTSSVVTLKVDSPPVFTLQPVANTAIAPGGSATLKVAVAGNAPFTYQWFKVGTGAINKATAATYAAKEAGTYFVKVFNALEVAGVQSNDAVVVVDAKPAITTQPVAPAGALTGGATNVDLTVVATGGGVLNYQWQKDGKNIPLAANATANSATLELHPINWVDRGAYKVIVSNRVGTVTSKVVTLAVGSAPVILTQPLNPTRAATGTAASFTVVAGGTAPLTYQWYFNTIDNPVAKATAAKLSLVKVTAPVHGGAYFCRVSSKFGGGSFVDSAPATLIVEDLPKVTSITSDKPAHKVGVNGSITLSATVSGNPTSYQWMKAGKPILGATAATLPFPQAQLTDSGAYTLVVTNSVGKATSAALNMFVLLPPSINQFPTDVTTIEETSVTFTVKASGSPTLKYQWQNHPPGQPANWANIIGKTAATLTLPKVLATDSNSYRCVVTNDVGSATSLEAVLTVQKIQPAVINYFLPTRGTSTELVRLRGANFSFVAGVKFGSVAAGYTVISDTEMLLTVPKGLSLTTGVPISVTNKGTAGTKVSTQLFTCTAADSNDYFQDAVILTGTDGSIAGDNTSFTTSSDREWGGDVANCWYTWTAPRTGTYRWIVNASFDSSIALYRGAPESGHSFASLISTQSFIGVSTEATAATLTKGTQIMIYVSGNDFGGYTSLGTFTLSWQATAFSMPGMDTVSTADTVVQSSYGDETNPAAPATEHLLGGSQSTTGDPRVLFGLFDADASAKEIVAACNLKFQTTPDSTDSDSFTLGIYDENRVPLAALKIDAPNGALSEIRADGSEQSLEQRLVSGSSHRFEISINREAGTWSATMDGVQIIFDSALPAGSVAGEIAPGWEPSNDGLPHASLSVDQIKVVASPEVSEK